MHVAHLLSWHIKRLFQFLAMFLNALSRFSPIISDAGISALAFHPSRSMAVTSSYGGEFKVY